VRDARFAYAAVRAALQIVDEARPKGTSIDRIERVLAEPSAEGAKKDDPATRPGHSLIAAGRVTAVAQRPTPSAAG
jgi:hypothetical protein